MLRAIGRINTGKSVVYVARCHLKTRQFSGLVYNTVAIQKPIALGINCNRLQERRLQTSSNAYSSVQPAQIESLLATPSSTLIAPVKLREYQQECIEQCLFYYGKGVKRQVVSLPVGSGKTVIFSNLIARIPSPTPQATRTLVIAHREELLNQAAKQISKFAPHLRVDIDQGSRHAIPATADVIVASVPSLGRKGTRRLDKYNPAEFKCIIIDEAHHAAATTYQRILSHFGVCHSPDEDQVETIEVEKVTEADNEAVLPESPFKSPIFVWGCSATVRRHDRVRLDGVFDYIAYHKDFLEMIEEGWLTNLRVTTIQTRVDLNKVKSLGNDFQQRQLANAVNTSERNELIVRSYQAYAEGRKSTLGFAVDIQHVKDLTTAFRMKGIDARYLTSETRSDERADLLNAFRQAKFPVLINCGILTEGTDIPNIDCLLMARPTRSQVLFLQMVGRGMRLSPNKVDCLTLDFVDTLQRQGLTTVPALVGLDERVVLKGKSVTDMTKLNADNELEEAEASNTPSIGTHDPNAFDNMNIIQSIKVTEYTTLDDVISGRSEMHIRKLSKYNWLRISHNAYLLSLPDASIRLEEKAGNWQIKYRLKLTAMGQPMRPESNADPRASKVLNGDGQHPSNTIADRRRHRGFTRYFTIDGFIPDTLKEAVHTADQWATARGGFTMPQLEWRAAWRYTPATPSQLRLLREKRIISDEDKDTASIPQSKQKSRLEAAANLVQSTLPSVQRGWTKGQAADMLTRIFEGGIAELRKRELDRQALEMEKQRKQAAREAFRVQVGPWQQSE
ncbi:P-loop containing nucleoside triphosphate hydrolase protein [Syncephalis fuscata]|nr:P-loop containing nucleoside triphosphate hydrolase protein [Syncephalis fuscata]